MPGKNENRMRAAASSIEAAAIAGTVELTARVVAASIDGLDEAPPAPIDTGELRASTRLTVGTRSREVSSMPYINMSEAELRRTFQLLGFSIGMKMVLTWIALHANIIDGGRRLDKNGRMIGSEQAPNGFVRQDLAAAAASMGDWVYRASSRRTA